MLFAREEKVENSRGLQFFNPSNFNRKQKQRERFEKSLKYENISLIFSILAKSACK